MLKYCRFVLIFVICFSIIVPTMSADQSSIRLYINEEPIVGITPIMNSDIVYVPIRKLMNYFGYTIYYDREGQDINILAENDAAKGAQKIYLSIGEYDDFIEVQHRDGGVYKYYTKHDGVLIKGTTYFPVDVIARILEHGVEYDHSSQRLNFNEYGYGQEEGIIKLISEYRYISTPELVATNNDLWKYYHHEIDYNQYIPINEIPLTESSLSIDSIIYTDADRAELQVTFINHTPILERKIIEEHVVREEEGQWKVSYSETLHYEEKLPDHINQTIADIIEQQYEQQQAVRSDLAAYFKAYNEEDLEQVLYYTSPLSILRWDYRMPSYSTKRESLMSSFESYDTTYKLTDDKVVFIGEKQAVVYGMLEWREVWEGEEESDIFPVFVYLEYANGHWNFENYVGLVLDNGLNEE